MHCNEPVAPRAECGVFVVLFRSVGTLHANNSRNLQAFLQKWQDDGNLAVNMLLPEKLCVITDESNQEIFTAWEVLLPNYFQKEAYFSIKNVLFR